MPFDPMYFLFIIPGVLLSMWASARVQSNAVANGELANKTDQLQKLDLSGHLRQGETARPAPGDEMRFLPSSAFETGQWIIEEIRQAPKARGRNLSVNPLIRKMFEKREDKLAGS